MLYLHIRAKPNIMKVMYLISKILTLDGLAQSRIISFEVLSLWTNLTPSGDRVR